MASTSRIGMRRSAAQLHALAKVELEIRATDPHFRRKYLREFAEAYTSYSRVLDSDQLATAIHSAEILLVGDYHALPRSQQFTAELVEDLAKRGRSVVLGLEMIFARDQRFVDDWQSGKIGDEQLRHRIRHDAEWGYDWEPLRDLLLRARAAGAVIRGLDCLPRGDLRRISIRDRHAASKIEDIHFENPDAIQVVLFGESHLAPQHLPKIVRRVLPDTRVLTLLQNVDPLYWQASGEALDSIHAVQVDDGTICVFNATPLEKYESYRQCIDRWRQERTGSPDVAPTFYNLVDALFRFLNIDKEELRRAARFLPDFLPEVLSVRNSEGLRRWMTGPQRASLSAGPAVRQGMSEDEIAPLKQRLDEAGCCYVPALNTMLVKQFEMCHASEEAARFLCSTGWGDVGMPAAAQSGEAAFYRTCLQHALVEYGSRVLCPGRPPIREYELYRFYGLDHDEPPDLPSISHRDFMQLLDFVVLHRDFELNTRQYRVVPELIREGRAYTDERFSFATQWLGRLMGSELYDAYLKGAVSKRSIRALFLDPSQNRKAAYFRLAHRCRSRSRALAA
jgi:hypothetical protein